VVSCFVGLLDEFDKGGVGQMLVDFFDEDGCEFALGS
jgi:hypothetical protein